MDGLVHLTNIIAEVETVMDSWTDCNVSFLRIQGSSGMRHANALTELQSTWLKCGARQLAYFFIPLPVISPLVLTLTGWRRVCMSFWPKTNYTGMKSKYGACLQVLSLWPGDAWSRRYGYLKMSNLATFADSTTLLENTIFSIPNFHIFTCL